MKELILASSSPRRKQILKELGLDFRISPPVFFEEKLEGAPSRQLVCSNALGKAKEVAVQCEDAIVIGCDTIIVFKDEVLGKPLSPEKAKDMLTKLSGQSHRVISGLAVIETNSSIELVGFEETIIKFRNLSENEIDIYIDSGEPLDKAGAYGIQAQGELFVERIEGSFSNVVGLPKALLLKFLAKFDFAI